MNKPVIVVGTVVHFVLAEHGCVPAIVTARYRHEETGHINYDIWVFPVDAMMLRQNVDFADRHEVHTIHLFTPGLIDADEDEDAHSHLKLVLPAPTEPTE